MTGMVTAHQTFGDMLRFNPHFHCLVLEGGFVQVWFIASRTKGKWTEHPEIVRHAPEGWKTAPQDLTIDEDIPEETECDISGKASRKAWARLLAKVYEIDPFVYPKCGSEMRVIAIIQDVAEIKKILKHFKKVGRAPPGVDYTTLVN